MRISRSTEAILLVLRGSSQKYRRPVRSSSGTVEGLRFILGKEVRHSEAENVEGLEGVWRSQKNMGGPEDVRGGEHVGQGFRDPVLSYALLLLFE